MAVAQQEDIGVVIMKLRESKTRVVQLQEQLDKERTNGKQLKAKRRRIARAGTALTTVCIPATLGD